MIDLASRFRGLRSLVERISGLDPASQELAQQTIVRIGEVAGVADAWEKKIVDQGNGMRVSELTESLYRDEVRAGAWAVDIGLWKHTFDGSVLKKIDELASRGVIYLWPRDGEREGMVWPTPGRRIAERPVKVPAQVPAQVKQGNAQPGNRPAPRLKPKKW